METERPLSKLRHFLLPQIHLPFLESHDKPRFPLVHYLGRTVTSLTDPCGVGPEAHFLL